MQYDDFYTLTVPGKGGGKTYKIKARSFKLCAALAICLAAFGLYALFAFMRYSVLQQEFAEYRERKAEYAARMQDLLDDNEKMLRDLQEMSTLEARLRRALIRDPESAQMLGDDDLAYNASLGGSGAEGIEPALALLETQSSNLKQRISVKKASMRELLAAMEERSDTLGTFPNLWPGEGGVISSYYGGRSAPIGGGYDWHTGIDIAVDFGTAVYASAAGTVEQSGWNGGYGRYVRIDHGNGYQTAYGHLSALAVEAGEDVRKGEVIGFAGSSGYSTGPHVHFEVLVDGAFIDPMYVLNSD